VRVWRLSETGGVRDPSRRSKDRLVIGACETVNNAHFADTDTRTKKTDLTCRSIDNDTTYLQSVMCMQTVWHLCIFIVRVSRLRLWLYGLWLTTLCLFSA